MKFILLNPHIDAEHPVAKKLQSMGVAVLFPMDSVEALQMLMLHGASIDLAIIHREANSQDAQGLGLEFISKVKKDPIQSDLPILLTTESWDDAQCSAHQQGTEGVNAYLRFPFSEDQLVEFIESVMGQSLSARPDSSSNGSGNSSGEGSGSLQLEEASALLLQPEAQSGTAEDGIVLEVPDFAKPPVEASPSPPSGITLSEMIPLGSQISELPESVENREARSGVSLSSIPTAAPIEIFQERPLLSEMILPPPPQNLPNIQNESHPEIQQEVQTAIQPDISSEIPSEIQSSLPHEILPNIPIDQEIEPHPQVGPDGFDLAQEMPYLYRDPLKRSSAKVAPLRDSSFILAEPLGDAVVPGGAAQTPDLETFKKYLLLREQDVAILSNQLKAAQDQIKVLEGVLREEKAQNSELSHIAHEQKRKIEDFEIQKKLEMDGMKAELEELQFKTKSKNERVRLLEVQMRDSADEMTNLKERVKSDIRKIRVREKELENRLEMVKKDSEALLAAREGKIIELKRKLDLLEFNMDLLQDQYTKEKENSVQLRERLARAAQIVRVAGGLLGTQKKNGLSSELSEVERLDGLIRDAETPAEEAS